MLTDWNVFAAGSRDGDVRTAPAEPALSSTLRSPSSAASTCSCNAASGPFAPEPFEQVSEQTLDDTLDVTVKGSFLVTQASARRTSDPTRGVVVMIQDVAAYAAVAILRGALRCEGGAGAVDAGARESTRAGHSRRRRRAGPVAVEAEQEPRRAREAALGRVGSARDVADAVVYLAGADFVTGSTPSSTADGCSNPHRPRCAGPGARSRLCSFFRLRPGRRASSR